MTHDDHSVNTERDNIIAQALRDTTPRQLYERAIRAEKRADAAENECDRLRFENKRLQGALLAARNAAAIHAQDIKDLNLITKNQEGE